MEPPMSLEMIFAMKRIEQEDFDRIGDRHNEFERNSESNEYPSVDFRVDGLLWKVDCPNGKPSQAITERFIDRFWQEFEDTQKCCEDELGFRPFFCLDGYVLMAKIPIKHMLAEREREVEEIEYLYRGDTINVESVEDHLANLEDIDESILKEVRKLNAWTEWSQNFIKGWKEEIANGVVIFDGDGGWDFVDKDWFKDTLEEEGWMIWEPNCKMCEKRIEEPEEKEMHENEHIQNRDEFYIKWRELQDKVKLGMAAKVEGQMRLEVDN